MKNLLKLKILLLLNKIAYSKLKEELKISLLLACGVIFLLVLLYVFFHILYRIASFPLIGGLLLFKILELALLIVSIMITVSTLLITFSTMYSSEELPMLFSTPIASRKIFLIKLFETMIQACWIPLVIFVLFIITFTMVKKLAPSFIFVSLLSFFPNLIFFSLVGVVIASLLIKLIPKENIRDLLLILFVTIGSVGYIVFKLIKPEKLADPLVFEQAIEYIAYLNIPIVRVSPSWICTKSLISYINSDMTSFLFNFIIPYILVLIVFLLVYYFIGEYYYSTWSKVSMATVKKIESKIKKQPKFISLFLKELKCFIRDSKQFTQLILLFALTSVYVFTIVKLPIEITHGFNINIKNLKSIVSLLNAIGIGTLTSAVCLRFVFPLVSYEGKCRWLMYSLPVNLYDVIKSKFIFSMIMTCFYSFVVILIVNYFLKVDFYQFGMNMLFTLIVSVTLVALALFFGTLLPNFKYENISQIQMSLSGVIYMLVSVFYVFLTSIFIFPYLNLLNLFIFFILSGVIVYSCLELSNSRLKNYEVID